MKRVPGLGGIPQTCIFDGAMRLGTDYVLNEVLFTLDYFFYLSGGGAQDLFLATRQVEDAHFERKTVSFSDLGGFQISKSCKKLHLATFLQSFATGFIYRYLRIHVSFRPCS